MNGFTRYVLYQLAVGMLLVTAGLTAVIWLSQSLRFVEMIVNRGLTAGTFMHLTLLLLPNFLSVILPIALFSVILFVYSKLISDRELIIMQGAGLNQLALAKPALILAGVVVIMGYALNLYLLPQSYRQFRLLQWDIRYGYSNVLLQEGVFNTLGTGTTVYVRQRTSEGQLLGILVHDQRDPKKPFTLLAERGALMQADGVSRVVMFNGNRQEVDKETNKLSILYFDRYVFDLGKPTGSKDNRYREARERSLGELLHPERDTVLNPRDYGKFTVEAHKRLISPFFSLGFTLVGLACLISGTFTRRTQTRRNTTAIVIIVGLQILALVIENAAAKNLSLLPLMYVNVAIPLVAGFMVMMRPPHRRGTPAADAAGEPV